MLWREHFGKKKQILLDRSLVPAEAVEAGSIQLLSLAESLQRAELGLLLPRTCLTYSIGRSCCCLRCCCDSPADYSSSCVVKTYLGSMDAWECMDTRPGTRPRRTPRTQDPPRGNKEARGTASPPKAPKRAKNTKRHQKHQKAPRKAALGSRQRHQREREGEPKQRANKIMFSSLRPLNVLLRH